MYDREQEPMDFVSEYDPFEDFLRDEETTPDFECECEFDIPF